MSLEELREKILEKARKEAEKIITEAKEEADKIIRRAEEEYKKKIEEARRRAIKKLIEEKNIEYVSKIVELNTEIVKLKNKVLDDVIREVRDKLNKLPESARMNSLKELIAEAVNSGIFGDEELIISVVKKDMPLAKKIVRSEPKLKSKVKEIREIDESYIGGVIVRSVLGGKAIDNTYASRIERGLPKLIEKLNNYVFSEEGR